jgi:hypothetical protein
LCPSQRGSWQRPCDPCMLHCATQCYPNQHSTVGARDNLKAQTDEIVGVALVEQGSALPSTCPFHHCLETLQVAIIACLPQLRSGSATNTSWSTMAGGGWNPIAYARQVCRLLALVLPSLQSFKLPVVYYKHSVAMRAWRCRRRNVLTRCTGAEHRCLAAE